MHNSIHNHFPSASSRSDLLVKVGDKVFQGHKFVFVARGSNWGVKSIADVAELGKAFWLSGDLSVCS